MTVQELRRLSGLKSQIDMQKERQQQLENELAQEKLRCLEVSLLSTVSKS